MTEVTVKAGETIKDVVIRRGPKYARLEFAIFGSDGKSFVEGVSLDFDRPDQSDFSWSEWRFLALPDSLLLEHHLDA
jgi:hypothetical protein